MASETSIGWRGSEVSVGVIDHDWLLKVRSVVARCGEMDRNKWWNTNGQLGPYGAKVLKRGFPRTHFFAQARSVFAVASHRCAEVFDPPKSFTLWRLADDIEEGFDARWEGWLDNASAWSPFFEKVAEQQAFGISEALMAFEIVSEAELAEANTLKRSSAGKAVRIPGVFSGTRREVALLALGFVRSAPGELFVPYVRQDG